MRLEPELTTGGRSRGGSQGVAVDVVVVSEVDVDVVDVVVDVDVVDDVVVVVVVV